MTPHGGKRGPAAGWGFGRGTNNRDSPVCQRTQRGLGHHEGRVIRLIASAVEIVLIDDARCDALVLLAEEIQNAIWNGRKQVDNGVDVLALARPYRIRDLIG